MPGTWTSKHFPQLESPIRVLVEQHRGLKDEPLHLAISYSSSRDPQGIFLFEVIGGNGGDRVNQDKELFETVFFSSPNFSMDVGQQLHLVLTNQREVDVALREKWQAILEIVDVVQSGECEVLWGDDVGQNVLNCLHSSSAAVTHLRYLNTTF